jgi:hypothetical protein
VTALPAGPPPPGARAADATAAGGLLVALSGSADGLRSLVRTVQAWLGRGSGVRRTIRLEIGGDALELSQASAADQERLIGMFISRHSEPPGGAPPGELAPGEVAPPP